MGFGETRYVSFRTMNNLDLPNGSVQTGGIPERITRPPYEKVIKCQSGQFENSLKVVVFFLRDGGVGVMK